MISIIVCTYNPVEEIFKRLIAAMSSLQQPATHDYEMIIVDNNSKEPVAHRLEIVNFLNLKNNVSIIVEKKPGLTSARLAGASKAKGDWLVFFDDDNEPQESYLVNLEKLIAEHPQVGCWGPGIVEVEYVGKNFHPWFNYNKHFFQEKNTAEILFDSKAQWLDCYPFGTGLSIRKEIVDAYKKNMIAGKYTLTDRIGKKLVSGGDTQLVFQGIKLGYLAGTSPTLQLHHLIASKKLKFKYMLQQVYMTSSCYVRAFNEIKFDNKQIELRFSGNKEILKTVYSTFKIHAGNMPLRDVLVVLYTKMGEINARYFAANRERKPVVLNLIERMINA